MKSLFILLLSFITVTAFAFNTKKVASKKKALTYKSIFNNKTIYNFSINNAAISMPTKVFNGIMHPGVEVGFSVPLKNAKPKLTVGADAGYYRQQGLQSAFYIKPNIAYKIPITKKLSITPKLGAGMVIMHNQNAEFKFESGIYTSVNRNIPQFMGSVGVQPSYNFYNSKTYKYNVFVRYEFAAQTPFSAISSILPITMLHLGITIQGSDNK
jgi:hypothetical protein